MTHQDNKGAPFETYVISEVLKADYEQGQKPQLSYWRDTRKNEIDLIVQHNLKPVQVIEIKSSATYNARYFDILNKVGENDLGLAPKARAVVYGGASPLHTQWGTRFPLVMSTMQPLHG
jgi:predicted AAA+ superfamily ATPase